MFARTNCSLVALAAGAMLTFTTAAFAGGCPADKVVVDGQGQKPSAAPAKGVTDTVLGSMELANQPVGVQDRVFRMRRLSIKPGGVVPWHSHDDRPALIYVAVGQVTEYASNCAVPIVHNPGDVAQEIKGTLHWWQNTGGGPAVLISADLLRQADDAHMM